MCWEAPVFTNLCLTRNLQLDYSVFAAVSCPLGLNGGEDFSPKMTKRMTKAARLHQYDRSFKGVPMLTVVQQTASHKLRAQAKSNLSSLLRNNGENERALLIEALSDLHNLLEEYAPSWYTEEHHRKAELALQSAKEY